MLVLLARLSAFLSIWNTWNFLCVPDREKRKKQRVWLARLGPYEMAVIQRWPEVSGAFGLY